MSEFQAPVAAAKIVLVEDDAAVASAVQTLLAHYEFKVSIARTLGEGRRQLASLLPELVILDLLLPDGDGLDLLERIRATNCQAGVIVLTGSADKEQQRRIARLKPARVIRKPLNFFELLDAIRQELDPTSAGSAQPAPI